MIKPLSCIMPITAADTTVGTMAYYVWEQPTSSRTMFCVHGLSRNGRDFDKLAASLSNHYRIICPDMPGRGKSSWLQDANLYNNGFYLTLIEKLYKEFHVEQVDWIGTSMGGILGMLIAATQPHKIRKLILNDIGACVPRSGLLRIAEYIGKRTEFLTRKDAENTLRERYASFGIDDKSDWQHLFETSLENLPGGRVRLAYDPSIGNALSDMSKIQDVDMWDIWNKITCPVLILRGSMSDILTHETASKMQSTAPDRVTYLEIPDAGHAPGLTRQDDILLIRRWLQAA